jgi:hypothetical protein
MIIGILAAFAIFTGGNAIVEHYTKCDTVIVKQVVVAAGTTEETRECKE